MFLLDAPERPKNPYGLTSVADMQMDRRALDGHVHQSFCGHGTLSFPFDCERVWDKEDTAERTLSEGKVFTTLTMETCGALGYDGPKATEITEESRSHALEQAFVDQFGPTATQIGTGPFEPKLAMAVATQYAATVMPGRPILHMQTALVDLIGEVDRHGNRLETTSGAIVSAGTGYDDTVWPGTTRIWVTGPVRIVQSLAYESKLTNQEQNEITSINETAYSMSVDCFVGYVEVTIA